MSRHGKCVLSVKHSTSLCPPFDACAVLPAPCHANLGLTRGTSLDLWHAPHLETVVTDLALLHVRRRVLAVVLVATVAVGLADILSQIIRGHLKGWLPKGRDKRKSESESARNVE